ncbi:hypothetical protein P9112_002814 [Eukaryota sp. TZLM1-RC]
MNETYPRETVPFKFGCPFLSLPDDSINHSSHHLLSTDFPVVASVITFSDFNYVINVSLSTPEPTSETSNLLPIFLKSLQRSLSPSHPLVISSSLLKVLGVSSALDFFSFRELCFLKSSEPSFATCISIYSVLSFDVMYQPLFNSEEIRLRQVKDLEDLDFAYTLFEKSFPPTEFSPRSKFEDLILNGTGNSTICFYLFTVLFNKEPASAFTIFRTPKFDMIELFAVELKFRNNGLGKTILTKIKQILRSCKDFPLILEVEDPRFAENDSEFDTSTRRIGFYGRNGFNLYQTCSQNQYLLPPLRSDTQPVPLSLMSFPSKIDEYSFKVFREILHLDVYQQKKVICTGSLN